MEFMKYFSLSFKLFFKEKALTLTEIVVAVALLGLVMVSLSGVFVRGLYAIKKGKYRAAAIHIGNQKYAELKSIDWGNPLGIPTERLDEPDCIIEGHTISIPNKNGDYIPWDITADPYEIYGLQEMADIEYDFYIKVDSYDRNLKKIMVTVSWKEVEGDRSIDLCTLLVRKE